MSDITPQAASGRVKYILAALAVVTAFFAAYGIAAGVSGEPGSAAAEAPVAVTAASESALSDVSACGGTCCGGQSVDVEGAAVLEGDIQRVAVDVTAGYFDPNIIKVAAGVPIEITFSAGSGCMAQVMFKDFAIFEDLSNDGAVVQLPALEPGEYA